ncbi:hypothetical protein [Winogradskyella sp.]|uniref:hypothetical protein n=1 Tax=Winogradskyella sp. TaxID=1883156 RepID=UPI0025FBEA70|nr:hypothetical protein [Winogradskyella sp.]MBT8245453.1 hypothetical protein [Winogradskyella sp.]
MKKRVFAVCAAVLFMGSNFTYAVEIEDTPACEFMAAELHENLVSLGVHHKISYEISGMALEACENAQLNP